MTEPKRFLIMCDIECSWEYEIFADTKEEALQMFKTGNHEYYVYQEHIGDIKATHIQDDNHNITDLSKGEN